MSSNLYYIRWDGYLDYERSSPWDLEPINENRRPTQVGVGVPVLPSEVASRLYRPRPEDWGGDRDSCERSECDRISAGLGQVMKLAIAEPFVTSVDPNLCPYPVDLSVIKARLDNRFYRRASAVEFDVRYIFTNARMFNQPESDIVRSAFKITNACIKIIRKNTAVAKYQMRVEGDGGTSGDVAERTEHKMKRNPNIRPRSHRFTNLKISNSETEEDSSELSSRNQVTEVKSKVNY